MILKLTIKSLFQHNSNKPVIKVAQCQRQKGSNDCGVYATAIAYAVNPSKLKLQQVTITFVTFLGKTCC